MITLHMLKLVGLFSLPILYLLGFLGMLTYAIVLGKTDGAKHGLVCALLSPVWFLFIIFALLKRKK